MPSIIEAWLRSSERITQPSSRLPSARRLASLAMKPDVNTSAASWAVQVGELVLELAHEHVRAGDVARPARADAVLGERPRGRLDDVGVQAHAEVVVGAPVDDDAAAAVGEPHERRAGRGALQLDEVPVAALLAQRVEALLERLESGRERGMSAAHGARWRRHAHGSTISSAAMSGSRTVIDRTRLASLVERERALFRERTPRSRALAEEARSVQIFGVPMPWMAKWVGGYPLFYAEAHGARIVDADGHSYVDFALGDTGSMPGHSPEPTVRAVARRIGRARGRDDDDADRGLDLGGRRAAQALRPALLAVRAHRHGRESLRPAHRAPDPAPAAGTRLQLVLPRLGRRDGRGHRRPTARRRPSPATSGRRSIPPRPPSSWSSTTWRACAARSRARDIACVLTEPALTNIGIVLPEPGFLEGLEQACRETGTLLVYDETHTISAGPGGCVAAWGLTPDILTIGKSLAAGVPVAAYGVSQAVLDRIEADDEGDYLDWGGVGGTLAGNALSLAATRATLAEVLTDEAFVRMTELATRYREGVQAAIDRHGVPWCIVQLGARAEYHFYPEPPASGGQAAALIDDELDDYLHLYTLNRGIVMTPFHNMALMCPATTEADVDLHSEVFDAAVGELAG